jgi:hypothetical protein
MSETTATYDQQIRYSRFGREEIPKNTLFTIRYEDNVYFGISRCNLKYDRCVKKEGIKFAKEKAQKALVDLKEFPCNFFIDAVGLSGKCNIFLLPALLEYFYFIDRR